MLSGYFDNSGTHNSSRTVVWGGFLGTTEQWSEFDRVWRSKLARPLDGKPSLRKFSLADCENGWKEFDRYSRAESDLLQNEMRQIIIDHKLLGVAFGVDRATWDRLVVGKARDLLGDAESACFGSCFSASIERALEYFASEQMISLHFDQGQLSPKLATIVSTVRNTYKGPPDLVNVTFDMVEKLTPLQAADIIATENYWHARSVLEGDGAKRPHLEHFLKRVSTEGYILDEQGILITLKDHGF